MKTAMQELREDLERTILVVDNALNRIVNETTRDRCKTAAKIVINDVIRRIDNELLETEKQQIQKAYNEGFEHADEIGSEDYYNETFKK